MAETVTLAVAHAFSTAYEAWRILPSTKEFAKTVTKENEKNNINQEKTEDVVEEKLIDFGDDDEPTMEISKDNFNNHWVY